MIQTITYMYELNKENFVQTALKMLTLVTF